MSDSKLNDLQSASVSGKAEKDDGRAQIRAHGNWLIEAIKMEIEKEETAIAEWNREHPTLPWKDDYPAMKRLAVLKEILSWPQPMNFSERLEPVKLEEYLEDIADRVLKELRDQGLDCVRPNGYYDVSKHIRQAVIVAVQAAGSVK